jgi:hypothetical protein
MTHHRRLHRWFSTAIAALSIGLLIALVSTALAACGYSGSNQGNTPSTQSQPQTQATQIPAQVQKCGIVQGLAHLEVPVSDNGAQQAENCFWQAFQSCHPATLVFIMTSAGTALIRTFTIHNNTGACSISDARQQRVVPNQPSAARTSTCTGLVQQQQSLHFLSCGEDGDVVVPGS